MISKKKKITAIILIVFALAVLTPWHIWVDNYSHPSGDRSQIWLDGLIYMLVIDNIDGGPDQSSGVSLHIPDIYCYQHIGGRTGAILFAVYKGSMDGRPYHTLVISVYGGDWWGEPHDYHPFGSDTIQLGNWCAAPVWQWSTSLYGIEVNNELPK